MRVAFVYDRVNKMGGAERVLLALHELYPHAPLFTSVYDPKGAPWAYDFDVRTTFLNHIPFFRQHHEYIPWLMPFAFESLSFDGFDLVISITSAEAKGIITKPETRHICYCLTPTRYLWSGYETYLNQTKNTVTGYFLFQLAPALRKWDLIAKERPDRYIAISKHVANRISKYYAKQADCVIYPPVDTDFFHPGDGKRQKGKYYLVVSRLVSYKRIDIIVETCSRMQLPLVVIGSGVELPTLKKIAGTTVRFITNNLTDSELLDYYQNCRAFIFSADEEFGIAAAEAQATGKPIVAFGTGGSAEIVEDGITGILYQQQSGKALEEALKTCESVEWNEQRIRKNALRFSKKRFKEEFMRYISKGNL